jgi:cytochrome P450
MVHHAPAAVPPGPRGHPLLGNLLELRQDPLRFMADSAKRYGDVVRYRVLGAPATLVTDPALIDQVLSAPPEEYHRGRVMQAVRPVLGDGLLTSDGDVWRRQRHTAQRAFAPERLRTYGVQMGAHADRAIRSWSDGGIRDVHRDLRLLTLDIASETLLGVDAGSDAAAIAAAVGIFLDRFSASLRTGMLVPFAIPTPGNLRLRQAVRRLDGVIQSAIDTRRTGSAVDHVLDSSVGSDTGPSRGSRDRDIRDLLAALLLAGHDTTTAALAWSASLLAMDPATQLKLADEVDRLPHSGPLTAADLPGLRHAEHVFREALRLFPPAWCVPRMAVRDGELGGFAIPAGSSVVVSQWVTHRDARLWPDPDAFRPERWAGPGASAIPRSMYFPFGGGARACPGRAFAMMEGTLVIATMARYFTWTLERSEPRPWATITLQPRGGVRIVLRARRAGTPEGIDA